LLSELRFAAAGVVEVRVAAVDDHVAVFEERGELIDHRVGGRAGVDHDDQPTGRSRACTNSCAVWAGTKFPSWPNWSTMAVVREVVRLCRATVYPCRA